MAPVGMIADASDEVCRDMSVGMSGLARALMDAFATIVAAAIGAIRHANASLARTADAFSLHVSHLVGHLKVASCFTHSGPSCVQWDHDTEVVQRETFIERETLPENQSWWTP